MVKDKAFEGLGPVFRWAQARDAGVTQLELGRLLESGRVERIGHGLYLRDDAPALDLDLVEVAARASEATLCLASALARHDLVDEIPSVIDLALPKNMHRPKLTAPVQWHQFDPATFEIGRNQLEVAPSFRIWMYDAPRSIVDAYRLRHHQGYELAREALRNWLRRPGSQPSDLMEVARRFPKAHRQLRDDLQVLL